MCNIKNTNNYNENTKLDKQIYLLLILLTFFIFIIPQHLRMGILGDSIGLINYASILIIVILLFKCLKKSNKFIIMLSVFGSFYITCTNIVTGMSIKNIILTVISFIFPLLLVGININELVFKSYIKRFMKIFNVLIVSITVIGVLNYITQGKAMIIVGKILSDDLQRMLQNQQSESLIRMFSFMGHPLFNTQLYLMFYVLNVLYNTYFSHLIRDIYIVIISGVGIALTMSKTGIVLWGISIIILKNKKIGFKYYLGISFIILLAIQSGLFNNTIERFLQGSLSTGRNEAWETYKAIGIYPIKVFYGYGLSSSYYLNNFSMWLVAAFEYPYRMFALEHGIIVTIIIYICIFIYPIFLLLKRKHIKILSAFLIVFMDINTFNGISLPGDYMLIFCIFVFIIINLSNYLIKQKR